MRLTKSTSYSEVFVRRGFTVVKTLKNTYLKVRYVKLKFFNHLSSLKPI